MSLRIIIGDARHKLAEMPAEGCVTRSRPRPSHHIVLTGKMMGVGKGAQREGDDYFLSRAAEVGGLHRGLGIDTGFPSI